MRSCLQPFAGCIQILPSQQAPLIYTLRRAPLLQPTASRSASQVGNYAEQPAVPPSEAGVLRQPEDEWRTRPPAVTLPKQLSRPAQWLLLAGFLKAMLLCATNYSLMAGFLHPTGPRALFAMLAFGAGLATIAKSLERSDMLQRPWLTRFTFIGFVLLLILSNSLLA